MFGTFVFAEVFPWLEAFYLSGDFGRATLPDVLGLPYGVVVFAVVLMARRRLLGRGLDRAEGRRASRGLGLTPLPRHGASGARTCDAH